MISTGSIFKNFFVPKSVNLTDKKFLTRLAKLEEYLLEKYHVEEIPNGWKCTAKAEHTPGIIVTKESVAFVMKNLGF